MLGISFDPVRYENMLKPQPVVVIWGSSDLLCPLITSTSESDPIFIHLAHVLSHVAVGIRLCVYEPVVRFDWEGKRDL